MALTSGTLWELRSGGNDDNGAGFYDRNPGTSVDYSGQDTAQLSLTDLATPGAGNTTLTSAVGGFTAAMAGNVIYIKSGTNFTAGYYEITVYTNTNTVTLDRSPTPGGAGSAGSGKVGGGRLTLTDAFIEGLTAGDSLYIEAGTYTPGANINVAKDGSDANGFITIEGYNASRGDDPVGDDRPLINNEAYTFHTGDYFYLKNLRFTNTGILGVQMGNYSSIKNVKCINMYVAATTGVAIALGAQGALAEDLEVIAPKCTGLRVHSVKNVVRAYAHDCYDGVVLIGGNYGISIRDSIMADCYHAGIDLSSATNSLIDNCTIDECDIGVSGTTGPRNNVENCQITNCNDGVKFTSVETVRLDYNNFHSNSTDVTAVEKGPNATAVDPSYATKTSVSGTTATTSSAVLTDGSADFTDIVDYETFCHVVSGTGVTPGICQITAHDVGAHTITLSPDPGDSATGDIVYWVRTSRDYSSGADAGGHGMAEMMEDVAI